MAVKELENFGIFRKKEAILGPNPPAEHVEEGVIDKDKAALAFKPETPQVLPESCLISATYDGEKRAACLRLYEPKSCKIYFWYDNTGHLPYCLSNLKSKELEKIEPLVKHSGFDHFERVKKYDPLEDKTIELTKIVAKDPLAIGGRPSGCIRDIIPKAWEADIRYYENYVYDRGLLLGMPYEIKGGNLIPVDFEPAEDVLRAVKKLFEVEDPDFMEYVNHWIRLFQCPVPDFRRVALDIEVYSPIATRVPNPHEANQPIIAVSLVGSDGKKRVLLLKRPEVDMGNTSLPSDVDVEYYDSEGEMILEVFKALLDYPIVLTFNGDDFDLRYLYHRAENLNFARDQIPIDLGRQFALLKYGIHVDLYRFFFNRSIQIYAFGQKYTEVTLNAVAEALLGVGKIELERPVSELSYTELAKYCLRDATITLDLSSFDDNLIMKLIMILVRISHMPMEDVTRQGVSGWIKSLMYYEHRRLNWLIPRSEDLLELKGVTATEAIIEGKKYRGAIVIGPSPGVYFNVSVLDFASLYPSIIKSFNLSYETVLCPHPECRDNKIPETPHWVCKKRRGLTSLVIGSLRDLRVKWYKPKSKDRDLPSAMRSWYNVVQQSLKVILNASYGIFGAEVFSLYCPPVAEGTASIGRYAITKTIEKAQSLGISVVYGDTDSIFLKDPTQKQIDKLVEWSDNELGMELDVDKVYRYVAFSLRKKNYLGVHPDGSVDIKGLTGKKRHIPPFLKNAFLEMILRLSEVKTTEDFEKTKQKIRDIVHTCYIKLKNRKYPVEDLAFSVMISKSPDQYVKTTPQHVKAAALLVRAGYEVKAGDIISFVKVTTDLGVKPVQLASPSEINMDKYMEYVESTFDQVLDAIGLDFDEIMGVTKLESFFDFNTS